VGWIDFRCDSDRRLADAEERGGLSIIHPLAEVWHPTISAQPTGPVLVPCDGELLAIDADGAFHLDDAGRRVLIMSARQALSTADGPHRLVDPGDAVLALTSGPHTPLRRCELVASREQLHIRQNQARADHRCRFISSGQTYVRSITVIDQASHCRAPRPPATRCPK